MRSSDTFSDSGKTVDKINSHDRQIFDTKHDEILMWLYDQISSKPDFLTNLLRLKPGETVANSKIHIEFPLRKETWRGNYSAAGFVDLALYGNVNKVLTKEQLEHNIKDPGFYELTRVEWAMFEVKTAVNLGETLRQIHYYSTIVPNLIWYVCAPAFHRKEILNSQGIGFIEFKRDSTDQPPEAPAQK